MRIMHTSDWHIGRTFHGHSTLDALRGVLETMVEQVRREKVDVVIVAGDVFDSAAPAAACYALLTDILVALADAGARVFVTSGNHDSVARLGFQSRLLRPEISVVTDPQAVATPLSIADEHGPVHFYGIPFLEPSLVRHHWPDAEIRTQEQALSHAMSLIRSDAAARGGRSVAVAHCFTAGVEPTPGVERDIQQGGLDVVPLSAFDGPDYVALGHIHGRQELSNRVRYSGAPLHYSFGEGDKPRGSWIVDVDASGLGQVRWCDLPVPRRLCTITGSFDELLTDSRFDDAEQSWVAAVYTDSTPERDAMRRLHERFAFCATVTHAPTIVRERDGVTYSQRVRAARNDIDLIDTFLAHVREGEGASEAERDVVSALARDSATAHRRA